MSQPHSQYQVRIALEMLICYLETLKSFYHIPKLLHFHTESVNLGSWMHINNIGYVQDKNVKGRKLCSSSSYLFHDFAEVASLCDFAKSQSFRRCAKKTSKRKEVIIWGEVRYLGEGETPILILSKYEVGSKLPIRDGHQLSSFQ